MAVSSVASPLCTWLVAACMSVEYEKDHYLFQSSRRLSRWARSKKSFLLQSITTGTIGGVTGERGKAMAVAVEPSKEVVFNDAIEALRISYKKMNPFCVPFATTNMGSAILAMDLGWMGPNYSISTACATSNFCILNAANHIIRAEAVSLGGFVACKALSQRNGDPTKASRPWDTNCDSFVMGEGAGVLLLEELEHAKRRGANIYAEFLDGSFMCDAYHMTEPHPDGAGVILCIEKALAQSGVAREDVNYINAHATSTQAGDMNEYEAHIRCFGKNPELRVNSTKSMIGHLLGASGAVEAVATMQVLIPCTLPCLEYIDKVMSWLYFVGSSST
ncbi:hypothetical protein GIB67_003335 [Kingdonia uniflora]|uniref:beta-ketoacyl-[acyl-carrier-protein] synthase I n=1 Tax=Kingdonia uniflora TaxID=39325 RepID=A0A7J7P8T5_9MAGN|nr:hypothetical protein GIB67_003335 [Kingdonia uniflora]